MLNLYEEEGHYVILSVGITSLTLCLPLKKRMILVFVDVMYKLLASDYCLMLIILPVNLVKPLVRFNMEFPNDEK